MDSVSDKSDTGVLMPPQTMVYGSMVCPVGASRDVEDDVSTSITSLPYDRSITQSAPPLCRTSDLIASTDHRVTKEDDGRPYTAPSQQSNTKVSSASLPMGNMSQMCKVCGEAAAGFHFGAFTCEGCKSFFGRTYNNLSSLNECKNSGRCVINKKTRTSCKSCRLRKCLMVGMSKSGSRYGRRSNWFKIHYLMQGNNNNSGNNTLANNDVSVSANTSATSISDVISSEHSATLSYASSSPVLSSPVSESKTLNPDFRDFKMASDFKLSPEFKIGSDFKSGLLDSKGLNSPTPSSSESHNSDTSLDMSEKSLFPPYPEHPYAKELLDLYSIPNLAPHLPPYLSPASLAQRYLYPYYPSLLTVYSRRQYLDSLLQKARQSEVTETIDVEDEPCDLASPNREFTPPTKFFKPNNIRHQHEIKVAVKSSHHSPVKSFTPLHHYLHGRDSLSGYNNPGHDLTPRGSPDNVPVAATAPQDLPIDLSVKQRSPSPRRLKSDDERSASSSPRGIKDEGKEKNYNHQESEDDEQREEEQKTPLDLSSV